MDYFIWFLIIHKITAIVGIFNDFSSVLRKQLESSLPLQHFANILIVRVYLNLITAMKSNHLLKNALTLPNYELLL